MKKLLNKNKETSRKLQKANEEYTKDLDYIHDEEFKALRGIIDKLKTELEAAVNEKDKLKGLFVKQKRKSLEIKGKVEKVEKVVSEERKKRKEREKIHSQLEDAAAVLLKAKATMKRRKSDQLQGRNS